MRTEPAFTDPPSLAADLRAAKQAFHSQFGGEPRWAACAPGRVNLIGEHVDYNDGLVLPMAIERQTVVVGGPRMPSNNAAGGAVPQPAEAERTTRVYSQLPDELRSIPLPASERPKLEGWVAYVQGVLAGMEQRNVAPGPLDLAITSSVPLGGGLSSSAAMEVAVATLIEAAGETVLPPLEKIRLCQTAEHEYAEVPCGIMDQFAATLSQANHFMLLDCRTLQTEMLRLEPPAPAVLIVNTNVRHELGNSEYAVRRRECRLAAESLQVDSLRDVSGAELQRRSAALDATIARRARHVVSEIERTRDAAAALRRGNWPAVGELLYASHASLRDDYQVSCHELDVLVELAQHLGVDGGVYGARMTGGGFGGCIVALVEPASLERITSTIVTGYQRATGIEPSWLVTRPGQGARTLALGP
jgi:galactokinase